MAKGYELSDDGKTYTLHLRKGMKWSDGAPFTADDFIFWFEDIYSNPEIVPTPTPEMRPQGKPGRMVKVDETTVRWEFDVPYFLFEDIMAGDTAMGGGQAVRQAAKVSFGAYAPGHYLKQFLPKYSSVDAVNARAKQEGFENWVQMLHFKKDWELNPEVPVLGPWRSVRPINNPIWLLERNPYYYAVDTAGNQLPYFDRVQFTLAENLEVINLRAMAGEYDEQERHIDLGKLPVLLDNQEKGNYKVHLDLGFAGSDFMFHVNQSYTGDAEVRKWLTNADFRRALALGIDRDQLNETFWLGVGTPGSPAPGETMPQSPGPEWRKKWSVLDVAQANALLDKIGLAKKDADGFRAAHRQWREAAPAGHRDRGVPAVSEAVRDGRRPVAQDRHPGRCEGDGARARLRQADQQRTSTVRLEQWRDRAAVPVPHLGGAGRFPAPAFGPALCGVVLVGRQAGHQAGRSEHPEDIRSLHRGRRPQGRRPQQATPRRSGRSWSISSTASARSASRRRDSACAWCRTGWAISPPACAMRSIAARRAIRIRRPGTSRHDAPAPLVIARSAATKQSPPQWGLLRYARQ